MAWKRNLLQLGGPSEEFHIRRRREEEEEEEEEEEASGTTGEVVEAWVVVGTMAGSVEVRSCKRETKEENQNKFKK